MDIKLDPTGLDFPRADILTAAGGFEVTLRVNTAGLERKVVAGAGGMLAL